MFCLIFYYHSPVFNLVDCLDKLVVWYKRKLFLGINIKFVIFGCVKKMDKLTGILFFIFSGVSEISAAVDCVMLRFVILFEKKHC